MTLPTALEPTSAFTALNLPFAEPLCIELLESLQKYLPKNAEQLHLGILRGECASIYVVETEQPIAVLWLHMDQVRDWFYAKYCHDSESMQEIEQELMENFSAQVT